MVLRLVLLSAVLALASSQGDVASPLPHDHMGDVIDTHIEVSAR